jgi:hypothetical protein
MLQFRPVRHTSSPHTNKILRALLFYALTFALTTAHTSDLYNEAARVAGCGSRHRVRVGIDISAHATEEHSESGAGVATPPWWWWWSRW